MDKINHNWTINIVLIAIILLLGWFHSCEVSKLKEENNLFKGINDTLEIIRNKDSSQTAKISLLQSSNVSAYLALENLEGINKQLQDELKKEKSKVKNGGSLAIINSETTFSSTIPTNSVVTSKINGCDSIFEASNKDTTWVKWNTIAKRQNTTIVLKVKDNYKVVIGSEKIGFLKRKPIAEVTSYNPYSNIKSMRAIEVKDERSDRLLSLSVQAGYGFTLKGVGPYLGCGISLNIIECIKMKR